MLVTYDSGMASVFQQSEGSEDVLGVIQYVGILKQILKLDYGPICLHPLCRFAVVG
jgi:hypothetical protein